MVQLGFFVGTNCSAGLKWLRFVFLNACMLYIFCPLTQREQKHPLNNAQQEVSQQVLFIELKRLNGCLF